MQNPDQTKTPSVKTIGFSATPQDYVDLPLTKDYSREDLAAALGIQ